MRKAGIFLVILALVFSIIPLNPSHAPIVSAAEQEPTTEIMYHLDVGHEAY